MAWGLSEKLEASYRRLGLEGETTRKPMLVRGAAATTIACMALCNGSAAAEREREREVG